MTAIIQDPDQSFQHNPELAERCQSAKQLVVNAHLEQEKIWEELEELEMCSHEGNIEWRL